MTSTPGFFAKSDDMTDELLTHCMVVRISFLKHARTTVNASYASQMHAVGDAYMHYIDHFPSSLNPESTSLPNWTSSGFAHSTVVSDFVALIVRSLVHEGQIVIDVGRAGNMTQSAEDAAESYDRARVSGGGLDSPAAMKHEVDNMTKSAEDAPGSYDPTRMSGGRLDSPAARNYDMGDGESASEFEFVSETESDIEYEYPSRDDVGGTIDPERNASTVSNADRNADLHNMTVIERNRISGARALSLTEPGLVSQLQEALDRSRRITYPPVVGAPEKSKYRKIVQYVGDPSKSDADFAKTERNPTYAVVYDPVKDSLMGAKFLGYMQRGGLSAPDADIISKWMKTQERPKLDHDHKIVPNPRNTIITLAAAEIVLAQCGIDDIFAPFIKCCKAERIIFS